MQDDIQRVLIDRHAVAARIDVLAAAIVADLEAEAAAENSVAQTAQEAAQRVAEGRAEAGTAAGGGAIEVTLVPILVGSMIFVSDLIRRLPLRMQIRVLSVSSYPGRSTASRGASVNAALTNLPEDLSGRHVLIIDDILDSGRTLRLATDLIRQRNPVSVRTCVLLRKARPEAMTQPVDYVAFDIPDEFVVGYGLDYDDYYRNLPDIVTLRPEVIRA